MKNRIPFWLKALGVAAAAVLLWDLLAFTSCTIPSTGMENALYRGERVWVSRWSYGWRVPLTTWRVGHGAIGRGDIVLFNNPNPRSASTPVARRELFLSRCVGIPGDTLMLNADMMVANERVCSPDAKALYSYPIEDEDTLVATLSSLGITGNCLVGYAGGRYIRSFSHYEYYLLRQRGFSSLRLAPVHRADCAEGHPFVVPARGQAVKVWPWNAALFCNTILRHEGRRATVKAGTLYVDGRPVEQFTFTQDYCWMASDNPVNLCDSRLFGLVPESHLIGRARRIWYPRSTSRFLQEVQ